jgi:activator of 2-hydroxyglutaryl-CoA dehydratase
VAGSGSTAVASLFGVPAESEFKAISRMMTAFYPEIRTVFEIGGRTFKRIPLEGCTDGRASITDYETGGVCEAGMGTFLEQQAARMRLSLEEMDSAACAAKQAPRISSGCAVFTKSDMIHAQQEGYSPEEVLRALCETIATKFKKSVVKGQPVTAPVALIGGVSQNGGLVKALGEAFQLKAGELIVPDLYAWCEAIGAAMLAAESRDKRKGVATFAEIRRSSNAEPKAPSDDIPPLSMEQVILPRDGVTPYVVPPGNKPISVFLGIDVGSVSTKLAVVDDAGTLIYDTYLPTAGMPVEAAKLGLEEIGRLWGDRLDVRGVGTTGSGRELIAEFVGADAVHDEITAHKTGAVHISRTFGGEPVDTIFDLGGQDSKYIFIENGVVIDFAMNDACAAGTGAPRGILHGGNRQRPDCESAERGSNTQPPGRPRVCRSPQFH